MKGAGTATVLSFVLMMALGISTEITKSGRLIANYQTKFLNVDGCQSPNSTIADSSEVHFLIQEYNLILEKRKAIISCINAAYSIS